MKRSTPETLRGLRRLAAAPLLALALAGCDSARLTTPQASATELPLPLHLTYKTTASPGGEVSLVLTRTGLTRAGAEASAAPRYRLRRLSESTSPGEVRRLTRGLGVSHPSRDVAVDESQCSIPPGTYIIVDSAGNVVGALIVYPNCSMRIVPVS